jgi:hypothetical protein
MRASRCVAFAWLCVVTGLLAVMAAPPLKADTPADTPLIDLPPSHSPDADLSFYDGWNKHFVDYYFREAKAAVARCDRVEFDKMKRGLENSLRDQVQKLNDSVRRSALGRGNPPPTATDIRRLDHDVIQLQKALEKMGNFEDRCPPPKQVGGLFELFLQGGGTASLQAVGFFQSLDSFPPPEQITRSGGAAQTTALFGGGVRVNVVKVNPTIFFETRFQTAFGATSFQQTFALSGPNTPATAPFGESLVRENWGIPLLLGATWSLGSFGREGPEVGLDVYGGITISSWSQSLRGGEAGAAGTPAFAAERDRTTVDPTFGLGLRFPVVGLTLGVYGEVSFREGGSLTVPSPSNAYLSYTGSIDSRVTSSLMVRVSIPLGAGPLFRRD